MNYLSSETIITCNHIVQVQNRPIHPGIEIPGILDHYPKKLRNGKGHLNFLVLLFGVTFWIDDRLGAVVDRLGAMLDRLRAVVDRLDAVEAKSAFLLSNFDA